MNSGHPDPSGGATDDSREKWITIDRLCDAYEASLQEGEVERAPFLAGVPKDWREQLTQELDAIDAAYRDAEETREQTIKVPASDVNSRRLPTTGRLAELATLDRDKVWLGRFEIRKRLGTGATGSVWCARDARLARWVALKVPHASRVMSETSAARFQTEARAAAAISHPNVVQVHEVLIEDGLPILIQQWIDGPSLAKYLKDHGPLEFDQAANWLAQIADAVSCAHEHGIVHRDLKPANVMLNKDRPMVLDFGLASYPQFSSGLTTEGTVLGTPAYMSPEQAEGAENSNQPATDIYALGTLLYEMLVGTPPFVGKAREVLQANKTAIPTPPRTRRSAIPRDLETITLRCLAKSPSGRYRSAAELRDDLQRFLRREPIHARKVSLAETVWVWARFHPAYALLVAGIPLVLVLLTGILISQLRQSQLNERANRLVRENQISEYERETLLEQRHMVELSRASHELSEGDRTRGLELLRSIPEPMRRWEWRLLDLISHSPGTLLNGGDIEGLGRMSTINALAVAGKRHQMFAASSDGTVVKWNMPKDKELFAKNQNERVGLGQPTVLFHASPAINAMVVSPDEKWLCWVDRDGTVTIWDLEENERSQRIPLAKLKRGFALAFSPDSKRLVIGGGSVATVDRKIDENSWMVFLECDASGTFVKAAERRWHDRPAVTSLCFVADQGFVVTRGRWDAPLGSMGFVEAWHCADKTLVQDGLIWRGLSMRGLDFNAATNRIAWCDDVGMTYLKDLRLPLDAPPQQFQACRRPASQVRFSPDGQEVVVTGNDGNVSRWAVATGADPDGEAAAPTVGGEEAGDEETGGTQDTSTAEVADDDIPADAAATQPLTQPPIRHIRDYRGHEHAVRDAIYLAPCRIVGGQDDADRGGYRFCEPMLVTGGEDGRVVWWSNQGHNEIGSLNVSDRSLVDATWVSPRQIALTTLGGKRQKPLYFKSYSMNNLGLSVDMRRVRSARGIGNVSCSKSIDPFSPAPPRFAVFTKTSLLVFETGNHEIVATRLIQDSKRSRFNDVVMVDPNHLVASFSSDIRLSRESAKANPGSSPVVHQECLLLYDLRSDSPPKKLVLPEIGSVARLKLAACGDRVFGGTRTGNVFAAALDMSDPDDLDWSKDSLQSWSVHEGAVTDLLFLADQFRLATIGEDGTCAIWSPMQTSEPEVDLESVAPNNTTGSASTPVAEQTTAVRLESFFGQRLLVSSSPVRHATASLTGDRIVTVSDDQVIRIWDTYSGLELVELQPRKTPVVAIEFSPDDRFLMIAESGSRIEVIRLRD